VAARPVNLIVRPHNVDEFCVEASLHRASKELQMASVGASKLRVGQVLEITFPRFIPRITLKSERELIVEILSGDSAGFTDTVEYETIAVRDGLLVLSWHIGSTVVHMLDLIAKQTHTFVTPAKGGFMRLNGQIELK
jgi:hypothetical protein